MSSLFVIMVIGNTIINNVVEVIVVGDMGNMAMIREVVGSVTKEIALVEI